MLHAGSTWQGLHVTDPQIVEDEEGVLVPSSIRPILKTIGVNEFMTLAIPQPGG